MGHSKFGPPVVAFTRAHEILQWLVDQAEREHLSYLAQTRVELFADGSGRFVFHTLALPTLIAVELSDKVGSNRWDSHREGDRTYMTLAFCQAMRMMNDGEEESGDGA